MTNIFIVLIKKLVRQKVNIPYTYIIYVFDLVTARIKYFENSLDFYGIICILDNI